MHLTWEAGGVVGWGWRQEARSLDAAKRSRGAGAAHDAPRRRRAQSGEAGGRSEEEGIWSADLHARVGELVAAGNQE